LREVNEKLSKELKQLNETLAETLKKAYNKNHPTTEMQRCIFMGELS